MFDYWLTFSPVLLGPSKGLPVGGDLAHNEVGGDSAAAGTGLTPPSLKTEMLV